MIRKTYIIITTMLIFLLGSFVQASTLPWTGSGGSSGQPTVSIDTVMASPGESITVPINVTNFTGIGSITFKIRYNPVFMNFTGISGAPSGFYANTTDSTISISFVAPNPPTYPDFTDGLLLNLNFYFFGMNSSQLSFLNTCEVTQGLTVIYPTYTSGAVNANVTNTCTATILGTTASTGGNITLPIKYENFGSNVGAITQKIKYDASVLNFINITSSGNLVGAIASASNGIVTITWTNTSGADINWAFNLINLHFQYIGSATTNVEFYSGSLIADNTSANIAVSYFNGTITPGVTTATAILGSVSGVTQGEDIDIPLTFSGLTSGTPNGVGALTLEIPYDNSILAYTGVANNTNSATVNNTGSTINISWTNTSAPDINGEFLKLNFKYIGIGNTTVNFGAGCSFVTLLEDVVQVAYTNATVTASISTTNNATIGSIPANQGSTVLVPISFSGLPTNMGAATLSLTYDETKLTYIDVQNNSHAATVGTTAPNKITITWASATATDINGTFLNLRFIKNAPNDDCLAAVNFASGCELTDISTAIVHANWNNGGVLETVAPTAIAKNIDAYLAPTGNITILAADVDNGSTDNCGIDTMTVVPNTFTCANIGANTVTLTVTDINGYVDSTTATVTVHDTIVPIVLTKNISAYLDASGNVSILAADVDNGSTDNCGIDTMTVAPNTFTCANIGANTVILTVTDENGNFSTATATVTVYDTIVPIVLTKNINAYLDASSNVSILAADIDNSSTDNCAIDTMIVAPNTFTCANIGVNTVILTVTDVNGNVDTASAIVTVYDTIVPVAIAQDITVVLDTNGNATITATQINNGSTDNCSIDTITVTPDIFTCANIGANTVTLIVTDESGNVSTATATVMIQSRFKVSGILRYNNTAGTVLNNCKVYLTDTNLVVIDSIITNSSGYYEFYAPNGIYKLDASTTKAYGGINSSDATRISMKVAGTPLPSENALRLQAIDVNLNGAIQSNDATYVSARNTGTKLPLYKAPDWIFGDINALFVSLEVNNYKTFLPRFTINCANITQNLWGICSGDVNGSYTPAP